MEMFRQALLLNETPSLVYFEPKVDKFKLENFAPFLMVITYTIYLKNSDAMYHVERNGNAKIILTDLSIKLTRLIHKNNNYEQCCIYFNFSVFSYFLHSVYMTNYFTGKIM
jgi:hypothetical protein